MDSLIYFLLFCFVAIPICAIIIYIIHKKRFSDENIADLTEPQKQDLLYAIIPEIKKPLKSPRTAVFCSPEELTVYKDKNNIFHVKSYVNSQNSFGALIKTEFTVMVKFNNGKWTVLSKSFHRF